MPSNPCYIVWSRNQEALASMWMQTKRTTYIVIKRETSPLWIVGLWIYWTSSHTLLVASHQYIYILPVNIIWPPSFSSSSSSCHAVSTDIPDPLSPLLPIIHRFWQVFRGTSVSSHSYCMYVRVGRPAFAGPMRVSIEVHHWWIWSLLL